MGTGPCTGQFSPCTMTPVSLSPASWFSATNGVPEFAPTGGWPPGGGPSPVGGGARTGPSDCGALVPTAVLIPQPAARSTATASADPSASATRRQGGPLRRGATTAPADAGCEPIVSSSPGAATGVSGPVPFLR